MTDAALVAATAHLHADAVALLTAHDPVSADQRRLRDDYLAHLASHPDALAKAGPPAHLTASCLVVDDSAEHVLLTLHAKARRWFQFGGHLEPGDVSVHAAATREAREESGLPQVTPAPDLVHLDRHPLVSGFGPCAEHLDLRFVAVAARGAVPVVSPESHDVRWWPVDALPEGPHGELADLVSAALRHLAR